jgi:hypothetical protein
MAGEAKKGSEFSVANSLSASDRIFILTSSGNNATAPCSVLFANTPTVSTSGNNAVSTANLIIRSSTAPANSSSPGIQGQVVWDSNSLYICVSSNTWIKFAATTF